ncbi:hypothetical protein [Streptomyces gelaticus]|nr:hypothetical protein [Streptomyces gelaticus]
MEVLSDGVVVVPEFRSPARKRQPDSWCHMMDYDLSFERPATPSNRR